MKSGLLFAIAAVVGAIATLLLGSLPSKLLRPESGVRPLGTVKLGELETQFFEVRKSDRTCLAGFTVRGRESDKRTEFWINCQ